MNYIKSWLKSMKPKEENYNVVNSYGKIVYKNVPENVAANFCLFCRIQNQDVFMEKVEK